MTKISRKAVAILLTVAATVSIIIVSMYTTLELTADRNGQDYGHLIATVTGEEHEVLERYRRLNEVYERLMNEYYIEPDSETLIQGAIDGMMASLDDPYTLYYTSEEMAETTDAHNGLYYGIGVLVTSDANGRLLVLRVFKDSPAYQAGILPGDILIQADDYMISAKTTDEMNDAIAHIKGEEGKRINITLLRKEQRMNVTAVCGNVSVNRVEYQLLEGNIGYVILYEFFGDAVEGVQEAFDYFAEQNVNGVIFDIRSNTGGRLDMCLDICRMVLPEGVIVYTEDRFGYREYYYSDDEHYEFPMVVLVNELTASASEIFSASVQEYGVGKIVGTKTFGKGIVQTQYPFPSDGAGMQLTTSRYYTASGRSIHKEGVIPDVTVELNDDYDAGIFGPDMNNDAQLKTAYDELVKMIHP